MTIHLETNIKGASLLRTARICAERDHRAALEMVSAAKGVSGLKGWRLMVARGLEIGETRDRARRLAICARKIAAFERPWWVSGGHVHATGLMCDGREYIIC